MTTEIPFGKAGRKRSDMANTPLFIVVLLLSLFPQVCGAKGGSMQPKPNKDFRELIIKGERPEIAACLVATIAYVRDDRHYSAIRWDDDASDRAVMRESESDGRFIRHIRLKAQMRAQGAIFFTGTWKSVDVSCEQPEDGTVQVSIKQAND